MTHIYISNVLELSDEDFEEKYLTLNKESQMRVDRKKNKHEANRSLHAYLLLKCALAKNGVVNFEFAINGNGKPYLKGQKDVFFNISHSADRVMCAVSDGEVGCDVQEISHVREGFAERFFAPEEAISVKSDEDFYRFWTLKESVAKAKGVPFMEVCKIPLETSAANMHTKHFTCDGYSFAVCAEKDGFCEPQTVNV